MIELGDLEQNLYVIFYYVERYPSKSITHNFWLPAYLSGMYGHLYTGPGLLVISLAEGSYLSLERDVTSYSFLFFISSRFNAQSLRTIRKE